MIIIVALAVFAASVACLVISVLLWIIGKRKRFPAAKWAAGLVLLLGLAAFCFGLLGSGMWLIALVAGAASPTAGVGARGTFCGTGKNFREVITIEDAPRSSFRHTVERDGAVICDERGTVTFDGEEVRLSPFTEWIDSKGPQLLGAPRKYDATEYYFFGGTPPDILKPWPEDDYALVKRP